ncbi:3-deoxy-D-manno-octulosonic acid kinase, partial [Vibrio parahaemolyticus EKP-028]
KECIKK